MGDGQAFGSGHARRVHIEEERLTVSVASEAAVPDESTKNPGVLGLLLAMAMFVLVVDTSLMNVSISAVVRDLGTTASGVQSAIAIEALVSAAFILISSKIADLTAASCFAIGLLGYAIGALAMVLSQFVVARRHFLLGDLRRPWRLPSAAVDAGTDPRQLRRGGPERRPTHLSGRRPPSRRPSVRSSVAS